MSARPLGLQYPVFFVDSTVLKVRDGLVHKTAFYVLMRITANRERKIRGIWAGDGVEGARFWLQVFSELNKRGTQTCWSPFVKGPRVCRRGARPLGSTRWCSSAWCT